MGLGVRGWTWVGLGICKVGGVGSRSNHSPWILCSAVRTISLKSFRKGSNYLNFVKLITKFFSLFVITIYE